LLPIGVSLDEAGPYVIISYVGTSYVGPSAGATHAASPVTQPANEHLESPWYASCNPEIIFFEFRNEDRSDKPHKRRTATHTYIEWTVARRL
jgi:hypothetical protein